MSSRWLKPVCIPSGYLKVGKCNNKQARAVPHLEDARKYTRSCELYWRAKINRKENIHCPWTETKSMDNLTRLLTEALRLEQS